MAFSSIIKGFRGGSGGKKNPPATRDTWVGNIPWRRAWQPTLLFWPGESPLTEEPTVRGVAKRRT